jgi:hypothetical protein
MKNTDTVVYDPSDESQSDIPEIEWEYRYRWFWGDFEPFVVVTGQLINKEQHPISKIELRAMIRNDLNSLMMETRKEYTRVSPDGEEFFFRFENLTQNQVKQMSDILIHARINDSAWFE